MKKGIRVGTTPKSYTQNQKHHLRLDIKKKFFYDEGGETLKQVAQRGGRCPIPGNIQGQVGRGSNLVEDVAAY